MTRGPYKVEAVFPSWPDSRASYIVSGPRVAAIIVDDRLRAKHIAHTLNDAWQAGARSKAAVR